MDNESDKAQESDSPGHLIITARHGQRDVTLRIECAGLLGVCIICLSQMLGISNLDGSNQLAVACFAIAIPCLAALVGLKSSSPRWFSVPLAILGIIGTIVGLAAVFFHFSGAAGISFIGLVAIITVGWLIAPSTMQKPTEREDRTAQVVDKS